MIIVSLTFHSLPKENLKCPQSSTCHLDSISQDDACQSSATEYASYFFPHAFPSGHSIASLFVWFRSPTPIGRLSLHSSLSQVLCSFLGGTGWRWRQLLMAVYCLILMWCGCVGAQSASGEASQPPQRACPAPQTCRLVWPPGCSHLQAVWLAFGLRIALHSQS